MSRWRLVWSGLSRKPVRTVLTGASLAMAFLLWGLLTPILIVFSGRGDFAGVDRVLVQPRHSITDFLPVSHEAAVAGLEGVRGTSHQTWFGGTFRDPANSFPRWAVPPASYLTVRPEILLDPGQRTAFLDTRTGAIVGRDTAVKYALNVGDRIALVPDIWSNKDGRAWEFDIVGVFDGADRTVDLTAMYFNYTFFDEYRAWGTGQVSYLLATLHSGVRPADVAAAIDARFANSSDETTTSSERDFALTFADQLGDLSLMLSVILSSVLFTIALVSANTVAHGMRERTAEFAILQALGFQRSSLVRMIFAESLCLIVLGAVPGMLGALLLLRAGGAQIPQLADLSVDLRTVGSACAIAGVLAVLAALSPAWRVWRLRVTDALRDV